MEITPGSTKESGTQPPTEIHIHLDWEKACVAAEGEEGHTLYPTSSAFLTQQSANGRSTVGINRVHGFRLESQATSSCGPG